MLTLLFSVVVISLSGVMLPGPMFAVTVAKSYRSPWAGTKIAIGHAVVEIPIILLIYFGFAPFFQNNNVQLVLSLLGGGMLIWMGIGMFRARREVVQGGSDLKYGAITAGIVMSVMNPLFLLWWATVGSMLVMKFTGFGKIGLPVLVITHWICDLIWLSITSILIYRTKALWKNKFQEWVFIACSLLLVGFGTWYLISGIQKINL